MEEKRRVNPTKKSGSSAKKTTSAKRTASHSHSDLSGKKNSGRNNSAVKKKSSHKVQPKKVQKKRKSGKNEYVGMKKRYSKRSNMFYYFFIALVVLIVAAGICFGFLFKAEKIKIVGTVSKYTDEQIISAGGLEYGDILFTIDSEKAERLIEGSLSHIETAQIKKRYPSTVLISVTEAKPMAVVESGKNRYIISDSYKIVDGLEGKIPKELILIRGFSITENIVGRKIKFENDDYLVNLNRLIESLKNNKLPVRAIEIDESGYFKANYGERIIIDFGNITNVDHKVRLAKQIIEDEIAENDKGILYISQENQGSFRIDMGNLGIEYRIDPD